MAYQSFYTMSDIITKLSYNWSCRMYEPFRQSILPGAKYSVISPVVMLCTLLSSLSILCLYISLF